MFSTPFQLHLCVTLSKLFNGRNCIMKFNIVGIYYIYILFLSTYYSLRCFRQSENQQNYCVELKF